MQHIRMIMLWITEEVTLKQCLAKKNLTKEANKKRKKHGKKSK